MGFAAGTNSCRKICACGVHPRTLRSPRPVPVASLKFGSGVKGLLLPAPGCVFPRGWGCGGAWEETPDAGTRLSTEPDCQAETSGTRLGQAEYLVWKRLCRPVLHNTGREGKAEWGG